MYQSHKKLNYFTLPSVISKECNKLLQFSQNLQEKCNPKKERLQNHEYTNNKNIQTEMLSII